MTNAMTWGCWCGGDLAPTRYRARSFALLRCLSCGCFRIDPPPITHDGESAAFYTDYYARAGGAADVPEGPASDRRSRFWRVVDQLPDLTHAGRTVIDFGSGDGRLCYELAAAGWTDVVGVEASRVRAARARSRYPGINFFDCPLGETPVARASADLCVLDNVIEHLPHPADVVRDLRTYLRPGGKIVVITPNMESGHFRLLGRRWTPELAPHAHIFLFTAASLRRLLSDAGLSVEHTGVFHEDPYPLHEWWARLTSGDVKGAAWRAHQELGAAYGRLIGAGPMLFAVGAPAVERIGAVPPAVHSAARVPSKGSTW